MNANTKYFSGCRVDAKKSFQPVDVDVLPDVPALPETLLALDLHRHEFSFDLRGIAQVVLEDLGATLQIFGLANREYGPVGPHQRIEDCICELGVDACLRVVERGTLAQPRNPRAIMNAWEHARIIGRYARLIAEQKPAGVIPEHAYLGGLMHELGNLPELLEWPGREEGARPALIAVNLAERWSLPTWLKNMFCENLVPGFNPIWSQMMGEAHRLARMSAPRASNLFVATEASTGRLSPL